MAFAARSQSRTLAKVAWLRCLQKTTIVGPTPDASCPVLICRYCAVSPDVRFEQKQTPRPKGHGQNFMRVTLPIHSRTSQVKGVQVVGDGRGRPQRSAASSGLALSHCLRFVSIGGYPTPLNRVDLMMLCATSCKTSSCILIGHFMVCWSSVWQARSLLNFSNGF